MIKSLCVVLAILAMTSSASATIVRFDTVLGNFDVQLFDTVMPITVQNFLNYVNTNRYNGTVVHRNSDTFDPGLGGNRDFVIQGGGFSLNDPNPPDPNANITYSSVDTDPPINDEPGGGVTGPSNTRGTIAMAKSGPNTVTSQWFINQGDNSTLDSPSRPDGGFSAFGMVLGNGMNVVDAIGDLPIPADFGFSIGVPFNDLPLRNFKGDEVSDVRVDNTVTVTSITELSLAPGDFNRNGLVNAADLTIFQNHYGMSQGAFFDDGDADMDGDVDGADFLLWQRSFGQSSPPISAVSAIPEPTSVVLAALGCLLIVSRRR